MRASDADRDQVIGALRDEFALGRLSHQTFLHRMDVAVHAKEHGDLDGLLVDLRPPAAPARSKLDNLRASLRAWLSRRGARRTDGQLAPVPEPLFLPSDLAGEFIIGREFDCDFTVADLSVSRRHARLCHESGAWLLSDLGSTNGTRLNGWRVTNNPVPVRAGDQLSLGTVTMVVADRHPDLGEFGQAEAAAG
jgi:hypothetical protein